MRNNTKVCQNVRKCVNHRENVSNPEKVKRKNKQNFCFLFSTNFSKSSTKICLPFSPGWGHSGQVFLKTPDNCSKKKCEKIVTFANNVFSFPLHQKYKFEVGMLRRYSNFTLVKAIFMSLLQERKQSEKLIEQIVQFLRYVCLFVL